MSKEVKLTPNKETALSQFDKMSIDDLDKPSPVARPAATPSISERQKERRKKVAVSAEATNTFRPVAAIESKKEFKAEAKPSVPTSMPKRERKGPKWLVPAILGGVVVLGVLITATGLGTKLQYAIKGIDTYYQKYEDNSTTASSTGISSIAKKFTRLSTDKAVEGTAILNLYPEGVAEFCKQDLAGEYRIKYYMEHGTGGESLTLNYTLQGQDMGSVETFQDYKSNTLYVKPSFMTQAVVVPYDDIALNDLLLPEGAKKFLLSTYGGTDTTVLISNLGDAEKLSKLLTPYATILKEADADYSYTTTAVKYDCDMVITRTSTWERFKPTLDGLVQQAKSDSTMQSIVNSAGIKSEAYLDVLNTVTSRLSSLYTSDTSKEIVEEIYIKDEKVIGRSLYLPSDNDLNSANLLMLCTDSQMRFAIADNSVTIFDIQLKFTNTNDVYTGSGSITTEKSVYSLQYENVSLGDVMTGTISIVENGGYTYNIGFNNGETVIRLSKNSTALLNLWIESATKTISGNPSTPSNSIDLRKGDSEKLAEAIGAALDTEKLQEYIQEYLFEKKDSLVDPEKLQENIVAYFMKFFDSTGSYTLPYRVKDLEYVKIDISEQVQESLDGANKNAKNLAFAMTQFITECKQNEKNTAPIANGVYTGYITDKSGNLQYQAIFAEKNMQECIGASVDPGYYCVLIKNEKVTYAYWSEFEDFSIRVANKDLPSHFTGIETLETVIGSYPVISTRSQ